jgi:putative thioredoxin
MTDVTLQNFENEVIESSQHVPVLLDFWAPWCGPCKTLGPMLEKLEAEGEGSWKLVKINVDENQDLASHFGVRSIPHVVAFSNGEAVDQFIGVLPESQLRDFIAKVTPQNHGLVVLHAARQLAAAGAVDEARASYEDLLGFEPADDIRIEYAAFLLDINAVEDARAQFGLLSANGAQADGHAAFKTRLEALDKLSGLPDEATLAARIAADPRDLAARRDLASVLIAQRHYEAALAQLIEIVRTDRTFEDDIGRKTMISVFEMLADQPEALSRWRRQLSAALN